MKDWPYPHSSRGTCVPECELFGRCHCLCGDRTNIARATMRKEHTVRGRPKVFVRYHTMKRYRVTPSRRAWQKSGIPVERVQPLVRFLVARYGSAISAACECGMIDRGARFSSILAGRYAFVAPKIARRIVAQVNRHRQPSALPVDAYFESVTERQGLTAREESLARMKKDFRLPKSHVDDALRAAIVRALQAGVWQEDVARLYEVSFSLVRQVAKKAGLPPAPRRRSFLAEVDRREALRRYAQGAA